MEQLIPGDLCVIIDHPDKAPYAEGLIGRTVVLIEVIGIYIGQHSPYWRCSGVPAGVIVSHQVLRKIPPDRMLDARMHDEPVNEIHDEEVKV